jgi:hypothetical protein
MNCTKQEEELAKKEYLSMIDALKSAEEFEHDWSGNWDDFEKESFGRKKTMVKGDKHKYMKYWLENQDIINDSEWNKINDNDEWENY